jgi:hypothetical protein
MSFQGNGRGVAPIGLASLTTRPNPGGQSAGVKSRPFDGHTLLPDRVQGKLL